MLRRGEILTSLLVGVLTRKKVLHITLFGVVNAMHGRLPPNL